MHWVASRKLRADASLSGHLEIGFDFTTGKFRYAGAVRAKGSVVTPLGSTCFDVGADIQLELLSSFP